MQRMLALARRVAESEASSVLLQGESGTGKDLVAKATHFASPRADYPFVAINCAAIPATLLESELFGYEKGAFTDAKGRKEGLFEQAEGGTIFLDEIGELELGLQAKLLRVLEEGAFRRVGGLKDLPLHVRMIAASNRDLRAESEAGRFRLDLYYRLSVIQIDLPPLRERGDDVLALADFYLKQFNQKLRKQMRGLAPDVAEQFRRYPWPGNVRELRNVIERVMILEDQDYITANWLPRGLAEEGALAAPAKPLALAATVPATVPAVEIATHSASALTHAPAAASVAHVAIPVIPANPAVPIEPPPPPPKTLADCFPLPADGVELEAVEMSLVEQALKRSGGNQTRAAELLRISRDQLRYRLKKLESGAAQAAASASTTA